MPMNAAAPHLRNGRGTAAAVDVIANSPESLPVDLNRAVAQIRATAALGGRGIRVTRRSASLFTVEAAADVPYGMTVENDSWQRPAAARPRTAGDEAAL